MKKAANIFYNPFRVVLAKLANCRTFRKYFFGKTANLLLSFIFLTNLQVTTFE